MNKYVIEAIKEYNFTIDKNHGYGYINGYEVNVIDNLMDTGPVFIFSTYLTSENKNEFIKKMKKTKISLLQVTVFEFGVIVKIGAWTGKGFVKQINKALPKILETLEELGAKKANVCPLSGQEIDQTNSKLITLPETPVKITLSSNSINDINNDIETSNEDYKTASNNYLKGFGGVLVGTLAGIGIMIVLSSFGYTAIIAPLAAIFIGVRLYVKFGGKPNIVMILMSFFTTLIGLLGTMFLLYVAASNALVLEAGVDLQGIEALKYCISNVEGFKGALIGELGYNALFIALAEIFSVAKLKLAIKRPKKIEG